MGEKFSNKKTGLMNKKTATNKQEKYKINKGRRSI